MAADININMEIQFDERVGSLCEGSERLLKWKSGPAYGRTNGLTVVGARDACASKNSTSALALLVAS